MDILTLDQLHWLANRLDFSPIPWPLYRAWPSPNYERFPWNICNGCRMPEGNARLNPSPRTPCTVRFLGLAYAPIMETSFLQLAMFFLDFSPWISSDIFSILIYIIYIHVLSIWNGKYIITSNLHVWSKVVPPEYHRGNRKHCQYWQS